MFACFFVKHAASADVKGEREGEQRKMMWWKGSRRGRGVHTTEKAEVTVRPASLKTNEKKKEIPNQSVDLDEARRRRKRYIAVLPTRV